MNVRRVVSLPICWKLPRSGAQTGGQVGWNNDVGFGKEGADNNYAVSTRLYITITNLHAT